ncbi:MAG: hypothetical protein ACRESK_10845, partial [Gammaproteobacteria bacterium]
EQIDGTGDNPLNSCSEMFYKLVRGNLVTWRQTVSRRDERRSRERSYKDVRAELSNTAGRAAKKAPLEPAWMYSQCV